MAERLTVSLEDGTLERLRTLAGGQRKVGAYLSDVVRFLVTYQDTVVQEDFQDLCIVRRVPSDDLPQQALREIEDSYQAWRLQLEAQTKEAEEKRDREIVELTQQMGKLQTEVSYWRAVIESAQLSQQQDGRHNDA